MKRLLARLLIVVAAIVVSIFGPRQPKLGSYTTAGPEY